MSGVKNGKCAYRFGAPNAMLEVRTATPVLHNGRSRCLAPCHGRQPAESGGHFQHTFERTRPAPPLRATRSGVSIMDPSGCSMTTTCPSSSISELNVLDRAGVEGRQHCTRQLVQHGNALLLHTAVWCQADWIKGAEEYQ